ncbi:TetR/AcrR family transcriptional regulator [Antrihabitans cavernicola]|uniref:TetR/AcrR family transcriptional regulator n=1 Tax=Antrihabitans cavernicola TaxID=2495913 RepID=A0A5A7SDX3_9NOCA|nr:TetR/AcrR family transcriptional regulator [Spelaeibacter cavernicola]KAA0022695.1 TetR/AcrR family transcriptional regulator [Spelaeibacter cavernicola]
MSEPIGRPGGRTARVRTAVLEATGDALARNGLHGLDLADIAAQAGVGKTTVYRRWGSGPALVADLLVDMAEQSSPRVETGSLLGDLEANARLVRKTLDDPRQGPLFAAIIAAATCDQRTAEALQHFYDVRIDEWTPCVEQAIERGEVPAGTDSVAVIRAVSAPLYYHLLTRTDQISEHVADTAAAAAETAAKAGVFAID